MLNLLKLRRRARQPKKKTTAGSGKQPPGQEPVRDRWIRGESRVFFGGGQAVAASAPVIRDLGVLVAVGTETCGR